ncbi:MAG: pyridoxal phosphate enzyme (YggS family) [Alcanivorax sp.]|jgi:pyridoxal phosphate enzyme (YggS family)
MDDHQLINNIAKVRQRVRLSAKKSQRKESDIRILAVSKTRTADRVRAAAAQGLHEFGENYLQEALNKIAQLQDLSLCWHFIGPIQSNKTRAIAENFHWVHSVEREKIALRLSSQRPDDFPPLQICLQVNISGEDSKAGVTLEDLPALATVVNTLPNLCLRGIMAIPAAHSEPEQRPFQEMRDAMLDLKQTITTIDTLSMGMSSDMEVAIDQGATIVRIGTDIFGPRDG